MARWQVKNVKQQLSYARSRYHHRKEKIIADLGGKCVVCGNTEGLELDHKDPTTKKYELYELCMLGEQKYRLEIDKCQLLCDKHHIEKSNGEKRTRNSIG